MPNNLRQPTLAGAECNSAIRRQQGNQPNPKDEQLVSVGYLGPVDNNEFNVVSSYFDWRQGPFKSLTAMRPGVDCDVMIGDTSRRINCYAVAANFLQTFGIAPVLGPRLLPCAASSASRCRAGPCGRPRVFPRAAQGRPQGPPLQRDFLTPSMGEDLAIEQ
jgi:hypothetical protein